MPNSTVEYVRIGGLQVHPLLAKVIEETICPDTGFSPSYFWCSLKQLIDELSPELERCLRQRDDLQAQIDAYYTEKKQKGVNMTSEECHKAATSFLNQIGYLVPDKGPVTINTQFVDPEIAQIPAPQLVCPVDNARFVLNAVNARWGSLFDALYGFDVIPQTAVQTGSGGGAGFDMASSGTTAAPPPAPAAGGYNPARGQAVIEFANNLLDEIVPLATGKWSEVTRLWPTFVGSTQQLAVQLQSGASTGLKTPSLYVGSSGSLGPPQGGQQAASTKPQPQVADKGRIFLKHNGLHLILEVDRQDRIGRTNLSGIKDIVMESALSAILDMEDSVSAVDAEDKANVYTNVNGIFRGTLEAQMVKGGKAITRGMARDLWFRGTDDSQCLLPGRAVCLIRNVGHHMFTDAVKTEGGRPVPEGFLDCLVTVASAVHDLRGTSRLCNSRTGSVYIVKPKMHGPEEVALTSRLFGRVEEFFGLRRNTVKMGIMDEERRTSANLRECIRAASERVFFINTGFLDRTGDEIHTCMLAGPVVRKADIKKEPWIQAYEKLNVDIGLYSGFPGKGQIGKGMWAKPDSMKAMLESKITEPMAGASTAWVPSPSGATLHSIHYHRVDVPARQAQLAMRPPSMLETLLQPPLLKQDLTKDDIEQELRENAQSILGYVVRWIDLGVGCSKVPDLSNVGLMEDRATLRISSQLMANWLKHGLITEAHLREVFAEMARVVDQQNARDRSYTPMSTNLEASVAYQAALKLVLDGLNAPNGYTEFTLHEFRRRAKASAPFAPSRL
mmetsp:Transcript_67389/g.161621  ORF Transcript_67389/g.161621 Transcript_67389/m.161621 type:complete len:785 (-) Transcript_67389:159-2513(-)